MKFTVEQLRAIETRDRQILVSAAAGSGKTAVLVERIIRRILDEDEPVDIDRLLVMTFTKAAATQMREKIIRAIEEKRIQNPAGLNLIRQSTLVHNAKITTIHGFCLDVLRDHFQEIGLDPGFRVADEGECRLLKKGVLEAVIEEAYEEGTEEFINMTECLASGKSDTVLEDMMDKLYEMSMSCPDPDSWLDMCISVYNEVSTDNCEDKEWMRVILDSAAIYIKDALNMAKSAYELTMDVGGPYMYSDAVGQDIDVLEKLAESQNYDEYRNRLIAVSWAKLGRASKNGPYVDPDIQESVKHVRNDYKASVNKLITDMFTISKEEHLCRIKECAPVVNELVRLTRRMIYKYAEEKRDRNIVDFSDLEHMCIRILSAKDGMTAREYREYFDEIYVDEYQDSNLVQEELLKYLAREDNLFMVGDVKQSIYSFRLARPQLFMAKYDSFRETGRRIDLRYNFRSRSSVIDVVNQLFTRIMCRNLGGIAYDDDARLYKGADYPETDARQEQTELILVRHEDGMNDRILEAKAVAMRIKELMKEQMVYDPTDDEPRRMRPVKYSDIVILLRSAKGWDERFKKTLIDEGVPVNVMSQSGYFGAYEVSVLLDYLKVLDNPLQDIPMTAVLRSVFGCFDDDELALLRKAYPVGCLYRSLTACTLCEEPAVSMNSEVLGAIRNKACLFIEKYDMLRSRLSYTPVYELLLNIIDGDYGTYISALSDGKRKLANLNMLLKKAEDYSKTSYKGLFHFVKYIEMLRKYEVDYGEANVADESDDAVRIMTIHKSKGLEFPVCFVAGLHKKYNLMDTNSSIIPDIDIGIGIDLVDPSRRTKQITAVRRAAAYKKYYEILAEEERILYVAMTRAKEKLIMTGVVKDTDEVLKKDKGIIKCTSFLDLIVHGISNNGIPAMSVNTVDSVSLLESEIKEVIGSETVKEELSNMIRSGERSEKSCNELDDMLKRRFSFIYPFENEKSSFEKISVTELKRRSMAAEETYDRELPEQTKAIYQNEEISHYIPAFIMEQDREISAALHGTAVHRILELWDYENGESDDDIRNFIKYVKDKGLMNESLADCIGVGEISEFLKSSLAERMKAANGRGQLYREQPFIFSCNDMLIQGIIDAYFLEDDEIVIIKQTGWMISMN